METNNEIQSREGVVKRMREIRDELSIKTMNMTFEELKAYYDEILSKSDFKVKSQE